jgi:predicted ABC-type ATPase
LAAAQPIWIIVAGPNGAGKTTIASHGPGGILREFLPGGAIERLNADERAREAEAAGAARGAAANLRAAQEIDAALARAIRDRRSVAVETVLSSDKYRPLLKRARRAGYFIALVYVCLRSPALSAARVRRRVLQGGHGVPRDRLAPRWRRSLDNLAWFGARADAVYVLDNSGGREGPRLLLAAFPEGMTAPGLDDPRQPAEIRAALEVVAAAHAG